MGSPISILLVGCGKMGSALLERWKEIFPQYHFNVIEPNGTHPSWHKTLGALPANHLPDVIIFAVKPQQLAEILPAYKKRFGNAPLYISIAAGKNIPFFKKHLGADIRVVRAMPNTPALIGKGMTALVASPALRDADKKMAEQLMQAAGKTQWVQDETLMDAVTALSGSGPAYVFLFLDALAKAAVKAGLEPGMARALAMETMAGSCALAAAGTESLEQLRKNVTSPGGTTEAALNVLMKNEALEKLVENAVQAAKERSKALAAE